MAGAKPSCSKEKLRQMAFFKAGTDGNIASGHDRK